jgi:small-conductance mechanosensitive channel
MASTQSEGPPSDVKRPKGYTPPKGRPTTHNVGRVSRSRLSPTVEWIIAIIVILIVLGAIVYFGSDIGGGGPTGAIPSALVQPATI